MANSCRHAKYLTQAGARKEAVRLKLNPRNNVEKCGICGKYRVVV